MVPHPDASGNKQTKKISLFQTTDIQGIKGPYKVELLLAKNSIYINKFTIYRQS